MIGSFLEKGGYIGLAMSIIFSVVSISFAIIWSILPSPTRRNCDPYPMSASVLQLLPAEDKRLDVLSPAPCHGD